jgi:hypothetical protein
MYQMMGCTRWGVKWKSAESEHIMFENTLPVLFNTRAEARTWIDAKYGYIRTRKDLRTLPHRWRIPIPVKVRVEIIP